MSETEGKFSRSFRWNVVGLAVAGVCGIALNTLIGLLYHEAALGVFNQVFATYIFASQFAVLGVHYSALQQIAATDDWRARQQAATAALAVTVVLGAGVGLAYWSSAGALAGLLGSDGVAVGIRYAAPGVALFAVGKVALACLIAVGRMGWYALLQGGRLVVMLAAFGVCAALDTSAERLPVVLAISEAVIVAVALLAIRDLFCRVSPTRFIQHAARHLAFGAKGFLSGVLTEVNSRVDVLMLGYFTTDALVGIYSFAAILAEGLFQLLVVVRTLYAPICTRLLSLGDNDKLISLVHRGRNRSYAWSLPIGAAAVGGYALIVPLLGRPALMDGLVPFAVLLVGVAACAGYVPFGQMLIYAGLPGWHTVMVLGVVCTNVAANAVLIPRFGTAGAAWATNCALAMMVILLRGLVRRQLRLPL